MNAQNGFAETWLTAFTETLRETLPQGMFASFGISDEDVLTACCRSIYFNPHP
jgi:hypothetical protein